MTITITTAANVEYTIATENPKRMQPVEAAHDQVEQKARSTRRR
jgi:hypothetical protein